MNIVGHVNVFSPRMQRVNLTTGTMSLDLRWKKKVKLLHLLSGFG